MQSLSRAGSVAAIDDRGQRDPNLKSDCRYLNPRVDCLCTHFPTIRYAVTSSTFLMLPSSDKPLAAAVQAGSVAKSRRVTVELAPPPALVFTSITISTSVHIIRPSRLQALPDKLAAVCRQPRSSSAQNIASFIGSGAGNQQHRGRRRS